MLAACRRSEATCPLRLTGTKPYSSNTAIARLRSSSVAIRGEDGASMTVSSAGKGARGAGTLTESVRDGPARLATLGGPTMPPCSLLVPAASCVKMGPAHQSQQTCKHSMGVDFQLSQNEIGAENSWDMGEGEAGV